MQYSIIEHVVKSCDFNTIDALLSVSRIFRKVTLQLMRANPLIIGLHNECINNPCGFWISKCKYTCFEENTNNLLLFPLNLRWERYGDWYIFINVIHRKYVTTVMEACPHTWPITMEVYLMSHARGAVIFRTCSLLLYLVCIGQIDEDVLNFDNTPVKMDPLSSLHFQQLDQEKLINLVQKFKKPFFETNEQIEETLPELWAALVEKEIEVRKRKRVLKRHNKKGRF